MGMDIGNERVLTALAETVAGFAETVIAEEDPTAHAPTEAAAVEETLDIRDRGVSPPAATPPAAAIPGATARAGRYEELGELGRGGLGVVLEVYDRDLRRGVALKRTREDPPRPAMVAALVEEAQIQAQLEHPNIPAVHALGVDAQGRPYFTMTRLGGQTLAELLRARHEDPELQAELTTGRLLRIFLQVGSAVAFAHDRGVVHRDLKPDNVMVGEFGEVRLMDWGIAWLTERSAQADANGGSAQGAVPDAAPARGHGPPDALARDTPSPRTASRHVTTSVRQPSRPSSAIAGTPGYAAPEQLRGDGQVPVDTRADIYGLGALLYEVLAGRPPVTGADTIQCIEATLAGEIPPLQSLVPVSERLAAVVHRALALSPKDRYPDVMCMMMDVEAVLEGRPVQALTETKLTRFRRWYMARSPRYARFRNFDIDMLTGSCMVGGAAIGAGVLWWLGPGAAGVLVAVTTAVALVMAIPPIHTAFRKPRPEDPGVVIPFTEGWTSHSYAHSRSDSSRNDG